MKKASLKQKLVECSPAFISPSKAKSVSSHKEKQSQNTITEAIKNIHRHKEK